MTKHTLTAILYDKKGRVLSVGQNNYVKSHPLMAKHAVGVGEPYKIYLHAEVHAILKCKDLNKAHRIFVARYGRQGDPLNAKPCPICMSAIKEAGIEIIEHT